MSVKFDLDAKPLLAAYGVTREFKYGANTIRALRGVDIALHQGEFVTLQGRSGSGKTTLLNLLSALDVPTEGEIVLFGRNVRTLGEGDRVRVRRDHVGILFQNAHLLPSLTAQENVEVALRLQRVSAYERIQRSREMLALVGLKERTEHRAMELSGGEQQRVALARALVRRPTILIGDEPTGALDVRTGQSIVRLLLDITHESKIGMLIATHDELVVRHADRNIQIRDGKNLT